MPSKQKIEQRRSTRVGEAVFLRVSGTDAAAQAFVEETATTYLNLHGCSYFSRHPGAKNSWLSIEIPHPQTGAAPHRLRARIVWNLQTKNLPGLSHVGAEFDAPGNVWDLASPPEDWRQARGRVATPTASESRGTESDATEPFVTSRVATGRGAAGADPAMNETRANAQPRQASDTTSPFFEREIAALQGVAATGTYYQLLQVTPDSPPSQVKRNYYELVRKWHPDRHMDHPERMQPLQNLMHTVTLAYKTLTDEGARVEYDQRLVASGVFALGRHRSDLQDITHECVAEAQKCFRAKNYGGSILWLRKVIEMEPASARYQTLLARSLAAVPRYRREALDRLEKAIKLDPSNVTAHLQLAELYEVMKLPWRARPCYQKVLQLDADNENAGERLLVLDDAEGKSGSSKHTLMDRILGRTSSLATTRAK